MEGTMAEQVQVGVIGTGFGREHPRAFGAHPRTVVTAVCSADADRARVVAAELGVQHAYGDYRALLDEAPVDAISIVTPPQLHRPMALAAFEAGKHSSARNRWPGRPPTRGSSSRPPGAAGWSTAPTCGSDSCRAASMPES